MTKINKSLRHQKTKFLMSKYLPVDTLHKRKNSQPAIVFSKKEEVKALKDLIDRNKKKKPSMVYYLNPRSKSLIPKIPSIEYRRRMGVDLETLNDNEIKLDKEHLGEYSPALKK